MALMNMVSSGIAELTLLISIIPIVYCIALGRIEGIPFDWAHRAEILLTATQGILGVVILSDMTLRWYEAGGLFILWISQIFYQYDASQIVLPAIGGQAFIPIIWNKLHIQVLTRYTIIYWIWIIVELFFIAFYYKRIPAIRELKKAWAGRR